MTNHDRDEPLTAERAAQIEAEVAFETMLEAPVRLPVRFKATSVSIEFDPVTGQDDVPGVVLTYQTPTGSQRVVFTRDEAITLASGLKKAAHRGLTTPESN
jgi:hypothetical protein